jgi:hypothetical protein
VNDQSNALRSREEWRPPADEPAAAKPQHEEERPARHSRNVMRSSSIETKRETYVIEYEDPEDLMNLDEEDCIEVKVTLDSGAVDHVGGPDDFPGYKPKLNPKARNFIGAGGDVIANLGEVHVVMETPDTELELRSTFQLARVTRALYSVSKMDDGGAEIRIKGGKAKVYKGEKHLMTFGREGGLYTSVMKLRKPKMDSQSPEDFHRQGKR